MAVPAEGISQGRFEAVIGLMLESLENVFLESVEVESRPRLEAGDGGEVELAFELTYTTADRPHRWWIECERSESAGSAAAVERLIAARSSLGDSRLIFLYHLERSLDGDLRQALVGSGIDHYSLKEFGIRLDEINCALAEDSGLDRALFRLELMKSSRRYPALRAAFSRMRVET